MESEKVEPKKINSYQNANLLSRATFWHTHKMFKNGYKRDLEEEDLGEIDPNFEAYKLGCRVEKQWGRHSRFRIFWIYFNIMGKSQMLIGLLAFFGICYDVVRPILISKIVAGIGNDEELTSPVVYGTVLIILQLMYSVYLQNCNVFLELLSVKLQAAVLSFFYRKFLKLPVGQAKLISFGSISNLITRDMNCFENFCGMVNMAWSGIISSILICYFIYSRIGVSALLGILAFVVFIPIQILGCRYIILLKKASSAKTDKRISILEESLSAVRTTKMYVWEKYTQNRILLARKEEMNVFFRLVTVFFGVITISLFMHNFTFYLVLTCSVWLGQELSSKDIIFVYSGFLGIGYYFTVAIPYASLHISEATAALSRVQALLNKLEIIPKEPFTRTLSDKVKIKFENVEIKKKEKSVVQNTNFELTYGLTVLNGSASSGKTLLLMSILKQIELDSGKVEVDGQVSYASQEPWLFPSTIRQNILFGSAYNPQRYEQVLTACSLHYDLSFLQNGDQTLVSEGGINLSKGQQSRINLARAIYRQADIYLLDNSLSTLDALVSHRILVNCILGFLKDKLVILVSNCPTIVSSATNILTITNQLVQYTQNQERRAFEHLDDELYQLQDQSELKELDSPMSKLIEPKARTKIYSEIKNSGSVSLASYKACIRFGGGFIFFGFMTASFLLTQTMTTWKDKLIGQWSEFEDSVFYSNVTNKSVFSAERNAIIYKYSGIVLGECLSNLLRACLVFQFAKNTSINLHKKMIQSVLNASLTFFDNTFTGNIVNRFTRDLMILDENIPFVFYHFTVITIEIVGSATLIAIINIRLLVHFAILLICIVLLRNCYIKTGTALKRLDASTKSPVLGYLKATWDGLSSIQAFEAEKILDEEFQQCQNTYSSALHCSISCLRASCFAADMCFLIFLTVAIFQLILFDTSVSPGEVGVIISRLFQMGRTISYAISQLGRLETNFTSIERAVDYTKIEQEPKLADESLDQWPDRGEIHYQNVSLCIKNYQILKNVNIGIQSGETVGIVGRTGAGKSSLISVLFNLYKFQGSIFIDGLDIKNISLNALRTAISVVPQDMILLDSSLRQNLDPEDQCTDEEIWKVLHTVCLASLISSLDTNIKELDFSYGRQQLLSLARVLLKTQNKILILDEMIENLDPDTETIVNDLIDRNFEGRTVIKIAHKLKFVLNCDKVIVMDKGEISEFGKPSVLLQNKDSLFYKMCKIQLLQ